MTEHWPEYQYMTKASRIKVLNAISTHQKGNSKKAINSLLKDFEQIRKSLALQDSLTGKTIFLLQLSEIIDVSSIILSQSSLNIRLLPRLTKTEKSFKLISEREFKVMYTLFTNIEKYSDATREKNQFFSLVAHLFYKLNMTINTITPIYDKAHHLSKLTHRDFVLASNLKEKKKPRSIRNFTGDSITSLMPSYNEYIAKFMDFDTKIILFNQKFHFKNSLSKVENPYYLGETPKVSKNGNLCFRGPFEDTHFLRCLITKI